MSKIYCDGYIVSGNGDACSGGFSVLADDDKVMKCKELREPHLTKGEADLQGLLQAIDLASDEDSVLPASAIALSCVRKGRSKKNPNLNKAITRAKRIASEKKLNLEFCPPERNLASIHNNDQLAGDPTGEISGGQANSKVAMTKDTPGMPWHFRTPSIARPWISPARSEPSLQVLRSRRQSICLAKRRLYTNTPRTSGPVLPKSTAFKRPSY